jgi:putative hemolysin
MTSDIWARIALVLLFILIAALFVAAEIALVSLRDTQVQQLASRGKRGKALAKLMLEPTRFLAAVQVGITFTSFISAGLGAAELVPVLKPVLEGFGLDPDFSSTISFILITLLVAYVSLVLGELVPKRLAIQQAETLALLFAIPIEVIAKATKPFIWLLTISTNAVLRIFGVDPQASREMMSGEELRDIVAAHEELTDEERELIDEVFEAQDRELREVMQPRTEVEFLDGEMPVFKAAKMISDLPHSRYPVMGESPDDVIGFVHIRDILDPAMSERSIRLSQLARTLQRYPGTKGVIPTLSDMRRKNVHFALVEDEYGGTAGIVTLEDLVEELIGDIKDEYDEQETAMVRGEVSVDGGMNLEDFLELTEIELPEGPYETVAGYVVAELGQLPEVGMSVDFEDHRLIVTEVENRRATRIKVEEIQPVDPVD